VQTHLRHDSDTDAVGQLLDLAANDPDLDARPYALFEQLNHPRV
jgi:hypothetical protein